MIRQFSSLEAPVLNLFGEWSLLEFMLLAGIGFLSLMVIKDLYTSMMVLAGSVGALSYVKQRTRVLTFSKLLLAALRYIYIRFFK
ncbi:MAG: hypothetical protein GXO26_01195 [Crenarchaeota archaeon]|nr:hypothetical protein [Thermoproteota archaeon]